jgi:hypothetical protein
VKRAYPAHVPGRDGRFFSVEAAVDYYRALGFSDFDGADGWRLLRKEGGKFEAYVCTVNAIEWQGSVSQLHD